MALFDISVFPYLFPNVQITTLTYDVIMNTFVQTNVSDFDVKIMTVVNVCNLTQPASNASIGTSKQWDDGYQNSAV